MNNPTQGNAPSTSRFRSPQVRQHSPLDRVLSGVGNALATSFGQAVSSRASPASGTAFAPLDGHERRHAAGLMRINHTGEVCAQALYLGQAALARDPHTRDWLMSAADEENDHLTWCGERLLELESRPSLFNPLWYAGSFAIGAAAAAASDRLSLGFVVETERQVEAHLGEHLERLPPQDARSRAVLEQMQADEARHADNALTRGGVELPFPVPTLMRWASRVMKTVVYRL